MRLLEYRQELFGHGYTVIGGDMNYESIYGRDCHKCTSIRMNLLLNSPRPHILTPEESAEVLATFVDVDWDDEEKGFFYANYTDIMKGKYPKWKLVAFRVMVNCVQLHFFNFDNEDCAYLLLRGDACGLNVKFEVPRLDGGPETQYLVSMEPGWGGHQQTKVTEYGNHVRREIEFFFKNSSKTNPLTDGQYIEVTEYADL